MKKRTIFFIVLVLLLILPAFTCSYANNLPEEIKLVSCRVNDYNYEPEVPLFTLPSSLTIIEDGAFDGTAMTNAVLQENVVTIGDYAFANIPTLRKISIPNSTTYIGRNTFKGSNNVTITGTPKGYARAWAHENGIPFNPIISFYAYNNTPQVNEGLTNSRTERVDVDSERTGDEKPKPTSRMIGELNAEKMETIIAFHIQGRSPPMA